MKPFANFVTNLGYNCIFSPVKDGWSVYSELHPPTKIPLNVLIPIIQEQNGCSRKK